LATTREIIGDVVRCVLFDAVGTLIYPCPSVAAAYHSVALRHGSTVTEAAIAERFGRAFCRQEAIDEEQNGTATDEARERRRWQSIVSETLGDVRDPAAAFDELWRHFASPENWRLFDDVGETWHRLFARGLRLGVASNFDGRLGQVCRGLPPLDRGSIFASSELGVRKPALDFFRRVEARLQLSAEQIMLVGDDWTNDYLAARQAGWQAVFLDRHGTQEPSCHVIRSLREFDVHMCL
jgi:putative hydrolase of the HAD superfamily